MKAIVDTSLCAGHKECVKACPEVFEMQDDVARVKVETVPPAQAEACRAAEIGCPMGAITIKE
jgi:ferredoxin